MQESYVSITEMQKQMIHQVALLHMTAFEGYPNTLVGLPYVKAFFRWFCESEISIALCAVDRTQTPLGYVVGAPVGYVTELNKTTLLPAVFGLITRPWLLFGPQFRQVVIRRLSAITGGSTQQSSSVPSLPTPTISLVGIGVHPREQGKKIGQALIKSFEERAAANDMRSMRLSVYTENATARQLYEKVGWQISDNPSEPATLLYYYKVIR